VDKIRKQIPGRRKARNDIGVSMMRIQEYVSGLNLETFKQAYKTVDAVIRNFEVIGEATKKLPREGGAAKVSVYAMVGHVPVKEQADARVLWR